MYLFAVSTNGYGTAPTSLLHGTGVTVDASGNGYVTTDSSGDFNITGLYTSYCPSPNSAVYLLSTGGNPGYGGVNPALEMADALPLTCSNLPNAPFLYVNELTTVAAAFALAPYATVATDSFATSATNTQALANAMAAANTIVNGYYGSVVSSGPYAKVNALADILTECVNTTDTAPCTTLFADVTPPRGTAPKDTLQAALDIALNPGNNVGTLYTYFSSYAPGPYYTPALAAAPPNWGIFPTIAWPAPAALTYGAALPAADLDATATMLGATVPGVFTYTPVAGKVLGAGTQTLSVSFAPTDTTNYAVTPGLTTLIVNQAAPVVTWATPAPIAYGTTLSATQLDATASVPGTFVYNPALGTTPAVGTDKLSVTFTPTDTIDYTAASATVSLTVTTGAAPITWATPAAITYGTPLTGAQLNATSTVSGSFAYSPAAGTVLPAGVALLSVTFTPSNTSLYNVTTATVKLLVNKKSPAIVWPTPSPVAYGTALSSTQLDAAVAMGPNITVLPPTATQAAQSVAVSTAPLPAGVLQSCTTYYNQAPSPGQSLTFVIVNSSGGWNFTVVNSFTVTAAATAGFQTFTAPPIPIAAGQLVGFWAPSGIEPGSGGQSAWGYSLGSQATLPTGSLTYGQYGGGYPVSCSVASNMTTPDMTIPAPVNAQGAGTVAISQAPLSTGILQSCSAAYYTAPAAGQSLTFVIATPNGSNTGTLNDAGISTSSYTITNSFTVSAAATTGVQTFTAPPIAITAGQRVGFWAASGTEPGLTGSDAFGSYFLNNVTTLPTGPTTYTGYHGDYAVACVVSAGQFTYTPPAGTVPAGGKDTLSVSFAPFDTTDYSTATDSVSLTVTQMTPTVAWATPPAIGYGTALSAIQLDATASVPGTFVYSPAAGTVPAVGTDTLSVTFTPTNPAYATVTSSVKLTVLSSISDSGTVTLTVAGVLAASTNYGAGATLGSIANGLANGVTPGSFVNVSASGNSVILQSKQAGAGTDYSYSIQTTSYDSTDFSQPSFAYPPLTGALTGGANASSGGSATVYSYYLAGPGGGRGYDFNNNVTSYVDSVTGTWSLGYDTLNRLTSGSNTPPASSPTSFYCWGYDPFGNRLTQSLSNQQFQTGTTLPCQPATSATLSTNNATYSTSNFMQSTNASGVLMYPTPDASGDVTNDGVNAYTYDAEGRICAVETKPASGGVLLEQYLYNAEGQRVAKGTIQFVTVNGQQTLSCDISMNQFVLTSQYLLGPSGDTETELNATGQLVHTNIYGGGGLLATYDSSANVHFHFHDWLGTVRVQANAAGVVEQKWFSLPFGDGLTPSNLGATEEHFTGKQRDTESGNDYFGARYYASEIGRFMSPDPVIISHELTNPQSWNKYAYAFNRPLSLTDPDGNWPGWYHERLDRDELGNYRHWSQHDQDVVVHESEHQDSINPFNGGQFASNSYQHAMSDGFKHEDRKAAEEHTDSFIQDSISQAVYWQLRADYEGPIECADCHDTSLRSLADALHAAQDSTSPEHRGYQPWYGYWPPTGIKHKVDEWLSALGATSDDRLAQGEARYVTYTTVQEFEDKLEKARKQHQTPQCFLTPQYCH